jgi:hypothetical protein
VLPTFSLGGVNIDTQRLAIAGAAGLGLARLTKRKAPK